MFLITHKTFMIITCHQMVVTKTLTICFSSGYLSDCLNYQHAKTPLCTFCPIKNLDLRKHDKQIPGIILLNSYIHPLHQDNKAIYQFLSDISCNTHPEQADADSQLCINVQAGSYSAAIITLVKHSQSQKIQSIRSLVKMSLGHYFLSTVTNNASTEQSTKNPISQNMELSNQ